MTCSTADLPSKHELVGYISWLRPGGLSRHHPRMALAEKILPLSDLAAWRKSVRADSQILVVTNGCFDLLHAGHVTYLESARSLGHRLLVGLNSDRSIRELKGAGRPVNPERDRATVLAALASVDAVCIFDDLRATEFLRIAQPDVYVKGGDFRVNQLPEEERRVVEQSGGIIRTLAHVPGRSTTAMLNRLGHSE